MTRHLIGSAMAMTLCLTVSLAQAAPRGGESRGGESRGGSEGKEGQQERGREGEQGGRGEGSSEKGAPGGEWSERTHSGKQSTAQSGNRQESGHGAATTGYAADQNKSQASGKEGAAGAAAANKNQPQYSGTQGAAAGAAAANRNQPQYSGAQGAAAGAAVANKNQPQYSGAEGAAAGAAAANRNQPQYSGAQGAAAGAAVANNNQPQYSGAQGAAMGAAAVNNNAPQSSGAQGAVAGAAVANNNQPQYSGAQGAAAGVAAANQNGATGSNDAAAAGLTAMRTSFNVSQPYSQAWCDTHPGTWVPSGWVAGAAWHPTDWNALAGLCGYGNVTPVSYDYGVNVTAQNGAVLLNGQSIGTTAQFSQQAADLAAKGWAAEVSPSEEWFPLGVYAMVRNEQQHAQFIVQLAINKQGILRGNYTDDVTDNTLLIRGAVDKSSKRAAWTVGDNKQTVMEAGLLDLTENETPALLHKGGKTDHWLLVRLTPPQAPPK